MSALGRGFQLDVKSFSAFSTQCVAPALPDHGDDYWRECYFTDTALGFYRWMNLNRSRVLVKCSVSASCPFLFVWCPSPRATLTHAQKTAVVNAWVFFFTPEPEPSHASETP